MADIIASDYQVLRDGRLQLDDGASEQFPFRILNGFLFSSSLRNQAILSFNIRPASDGRLTVRAGGGLGTAFVNNRFFSQSHTRMHQETFNLSGIVAEMNDNDAVPIGTLLIDFQVEDGPLILSDIVIHYKVTIAEFLQ